jgi:O-antigen ligase
MIGRLTGGHVLIAAAVVTPPLALYANKGVAPLLFVLAVLALAVLARRRRLVAIVTLPSFWLVAALLGWAMLSSLWAADRAHAAVAALAVGGTVLAAMVVVVAALEVDPDWLGMAGWQMAGLLLGAIAILEYFNGHHLHALAWRLMERPDQWRWSGANSAAVALILLMWPAVIAGWRMGWRLGVLAALVMVAMTVAMADSIAAKIALAAGFAAFAAVAWGGRRVVMAITLAVAIGVMTAPGLALFLPAVEASPPQTTLSPPPAEATPQQPNLLGHARQSGGHRLMIWRFVAQRAMEKPLLGWGMDAARAMPGGKNIIFGETGESLPLHPHNAALQFWLELGAIGAALFALVLAYIGQAIWRMKASPMVQGAAAANFVSAFVVLSLSWGIWQKWWLAVLGISVALTVAVSRDERKFAGRQKT